ncbi:hypothetical protein JTE90_016579 [Oedothorax gibbosus]|uniref:Uncharacterized protein n=1 Tax=Oedothorax gibbosus TaxID=931172 RepID=A0AAV6UCB1_9ARAC|nr:hypothetical protein JTE90_016579 [Oedothorax gibbosus]
MSLRPYIGLLSEYQKEYLNYSGKDCSLTKRRNLAAGVPSLPSPDCRPKEYSSEDGLLPVFHGKSVAKSDYVPQPRIARTQNFKVECSTKEAGTKNEAGINGSAQIKPDRPPMLLLPGMQETESEAKASYRPFPLELARSEGTPFLRTKNGEPENRAPRWDLTSSYQADYCGIRTQPRRICLEERSAHHKDTSCKYNTSNSSKLEGQTCKQNCKENVHDQLSSYVKSLLFRTTTGSAYRPPSTFRGPPCHPAKEQKCPAEDILPQKCEIHCKQQN